MSPLRLTLSTPDRRLFDGEIYQVNLPTTDGEMGVRGGHAPVVVALAPGVIEVILEAGKEPEHFAVTGGFGEIKGDLVTLLASGAEEAASLEEEAVIEARRRAEEARQNAQTDEELNEAKVLLERSLSQLKTIQRRKKWRS